MASKLVSRDVLYPELSYQIMESVFEVHNRLGPGFSEDIYQKATALELATHNIPFEQQKTIQVFYKEHCLGNFRLDLIVDDKIILELKAVAAFIDLHKQQLLSYLKATGLQLGILINFGSKRVEYTRIINTIR